MLPFKYKYTVIIPHKNCPDLLQRCIDSIPERDDVEIIIVDDNSDNEHVDFNYFPGMNRKGVQLLFKKEGKGAGFARNQGLNIAQGQWIMFSDSDDFYEPRAFDIIDKNLDDSIDVLHFASLSRNSDTLEVSHERRVVSNESVVNYIENSPLADARLRFRNSAPWNKVIQHTIIQKNNLRFEEIPMNNDVFFALRLSLVATRYKVLKDPLYCFTFRANSISTTKRTFRDENILLITRIRTNQFFKSIGHPELKRSYLGILNAIYKRNGLKYFLGYLAFLSKKFSYLLAVKKNWNNPEIVNKR